MFQKPAFKGLMGDLDGLWIDEQGMATVVTWIMAAEGYFTPRTSVYTPAYCLQSCRTTAPLSKSRVIDRHINDWTNCRLASVGLDRVQKLVDPHRPLDQQFADAPTAMCIVGQAEAGPVVICFGVGEQKDETQLASR